MTDQISNYDNFVDDMLVSELSIKDAVIAMSEEIGEACGKVKRLNRGDYKKFDHSEFESLSGDIYPDKFVEDLGKELGDVLYYLTACAHSLGYGLGDIMDGNMEKLYARKNAGTIKGTGDSR